MKKNHRTKEEYISAAEKAHSISEMCKLLGRNPCGAGYYIMKKKIKEYNIDTSHFLGKGWNKGLKINPNEFRIKKMDEILVKDSTYTNTNTLKKRLINEHIKEFKCEKCGLSEWNGKPIPLELHHINGDRKDNRIVNLEILCANCHAQTDNYCSKNKKQEKNDYVVTKEQTKNKDIEQNSKEGNENIGICEICGKSYIKKEKAQHFCSHDCFYKSARKLKKEITKEILINAFVTFKSFVKVGEYFGISDKAIVKWCVKFGLPTKKKEMNLFLKEIIRQNVTNAPMV